MPRPQTATIFESVTIVIDPMANLAILTGHQSMEPTRMTIEQVIAALANIQAELRTMTAPAPTPRAVTHPYLDMEDTTRPIR